MWKVRLYVVCSAYLVRTEGVHAQHAPGGGRVDAGCGHSSACCCVAVTIVAAACAPTECTMLSCCPSDLRCARKRGGLASAVGMWLVVSACLVVSCCAVLCGLLPHADASAGLWGAPLQRQRLHPLCLSKATHVCVCMCERGSRPACSLMGLSQCCCCRRIVFSCITRAGIVEQDKAV